MPFLQSSVARASAFFSVARIMASSGDFVKISAISSFVMATDDDDVLYATLVAHFTTSSSSDSAGNTAVIRL